MDRHAIFSLFRSRFLSLFVVIAWAALGADSGLCAEGGTAPAAPAASPEPVPSLPSGPSSTPTSSPASDLSSTPAASPSSPAGNKPTIAEWLNQTVRVRDTVEALDGPSSDGKAAGRIRAGAEVKAIGIISGWQWVQIELPDQRVAFIPSKAIELNNTPVPSSVQGPEPPVATTPGTTSPETTSTVADVRGPVTRVPNAATLVVADQRIRLLGIDPGPLNFLSSFENWVRGKVPCRANRSHRPVDIDASQPAESMSPRRPS